MNIFLFLLVAQWLNALCVSSIPSDIPDEELLPRIDSLNTINQGLLAQDECSAELDNPLLDDPAQLLKRLDELDRLDVSPFLSLSTHRYHPKVTPSTSQPHDDKGTLEGQSSLRQVLLIHRHGERSIVDFGCTDPLENEPFWKFHGLGELTNKGKARMFWLGRVVRERYNEFLQKSVNKNQRISRSSGILRCIESSQLFLAGFIGLDLPESQDASKLIWDDQTTNPLAGLWQPASIQSFTAPFDGMFPGWRCEKLDSEYANVINASSEVRAIFNKFHRERRVLDDVLGAEMNYFRRWFWASSVLQTEKSFFPDKIQSELLEVYDNVMKAGYLSMGAFQSTLTAKRLRSGLLAGDMVRHMNKFRDLHSELAGDSTELKKFLHYSAHETNLIALLGMLDSWGTFDEPGFSSSIVIELHEDKSEWFVRILYMAHFPGDYAEVHWDRCESGHPTKRCTLDKFTQLMRPYMIDNWQTWVKECGNDLTKFDPYIY